MDRRSFIKLTAVSGTTVALASCGNPENQFIRFVPDEDIYPGIAVWKPAVCGLCAAGCGLTVRVLDADRDVVRDGQPGIVKIYAAKKFEGSPEHPVNHGGLCARGQAGLQVTYHPDRITQPLRRTGDRGSLSYEAVSWDDALADLVSHLDGLEGDGNQVGLAYLTGGRSGHRRLLIDRFLASFGARGPIVYELFGDDVVRRANALSFGRAQLPTFDLANARYVLGLGADFLGTWNSPVANNHAYGLMRQGRRGIRGLLTQVEPRMSLTGASADQWVPARPGTEGVLALGLAHVIMASGSHAPANAGRAGAMVEGWATGLADYTPDAVAERTGVSASRIEGLATEFAGIAPAVAIVGGPPLAHTNGLATALAVNALNALVGNVGQPGGLQFTPQVRLPGVADGRGAGTSLSLDGVVRGMLDAGSPVPQVLLVDGANPLFSAPPSWRVREAFEKVPYIVSFGSFLDETAALADLILPDHSFLESWTESLPESGSLVAVAGAAGPVMAPLYDTRATPDVLLDVSRRLRRPLDLPWESFDGLLAETFAALPDGEAFDAWTTAQENGYWSGDLPASQATPLAFEAAGVPVAPADPRFDGDASEYPLHLLPYASNAFLDGSLAHLPWLQEMPDPLTSAMWSSWVEINPATAASLGIGEGDVVEVASGHGAVQAAAVLSPGIAPDVLAMPVGQGHQTFTRYASGRGANPVELLAPMSEDSTGALAWAATRVRVWRVSGPDGRLVLFAGALREHAEPHR